MVMELWLPPDHRYESVEAYIAAMKERFWVGAEVFHQVASSTVCYAVADGWMKLRVSTIFLMIDHGWREGSPPVLWETMVFDWPGDLDMHEADCNRYTSAKAATRGHKQMLTEARLALDAAHYPVLATVTSQCKWWTE